jgi:opacity protein-like surface antigen
MFKRVIALVLTLALVASVAAALDFDRKHWYGQGILALPMGNFGDIANLGIGAGIGLSAPSADEWQFRGEVSYVYFTTEDFEGGDYSISLIPINVLAEYHLTDSQAYLLGGLGIVMRRVKIEWDDDPIFGGGSVSDTDSEIGLILGGGLQLSEGMTLEGRLNLISNTNHISAHIGFAF